MLTLGTKPLTSKPGEFLARCTTLGRVVKVHLATPEQKAAARLLGLNRRTLGRDSRGKEIWAWSFPAHDEPFETTDREAYRRHLEEFHGGGVTKLSGPWLAARWKGPRLKAEGNDAHLRGRADLRVCPTCGLVAEVAETAYTAGEPWWDEHVADCAIATARAAS